ncbi:DUF397 domain-containing protein [Micromonospora sp. WMMD710]|uniref:DUF397 domain-containing protein n=1 Tax=Micromonospora sp. WMMD710 TaxID=3016085 RepID=UPI0024170E07|nr:DUF397 domain-containing protein [Micromonospora sp. WMMD710]MDG4760028.1 DUF397 domain-containing protein [Micromonospora sp. WMMD710]
MSDPQFTNTSDPRFTQWMKSPDSGPNEGCLYVSGSADGSGDVALVESEAGPDAPIQVVPRRSWSAFLSGARSGAFDHI